MKFILGFLFCAFISFTYAIHNGEIVEPNSIPYQVLIYVKRNGHTSKCGGSLIKTDRVLTAAHCLRDRDSATVIVGAHREHHHERTRQTQVLDPEYLIPNPHWQPGKGHDVGIIKLPEPFELNEYVQLVKLPYGYENDTFEGDVAKVTGWGIVGKQLKILINIIISMKTISDQEDDSVIALRSTENQIISNHDCRKQFKKIHEGNICMSGKGARKSCR
jgi:secreted trypsin-like serine protease